MKISKKIIAVVLTVLMVFSLVPLSAFAATEWNIQDFEITQLQQGDSITSDVEYIDGFYGYEVRLLANGYQEQSSVRNYDTVGSEMGFRFGEIDQRFLPYGSDKWYVIAVDHDAQTIILSGDADATPATTYTATWKNYNGTVLRTDTNLEEGTTPTYFGKMPAKPSTDTHFYAFSGWTPAVAPIAADAIYTATFTEMAKSSTVDGCETFVTKSSTSEKTFSGDHFSITNSVIALDTGCMANTNSKTTVSSLNGEKITKLVLTRASGNNIAPVVYVNGTAVNATQSGDVFTFDNLNATSVQIGTDSSSWTKTAELVAYYKEAGTGVAEVNGTQYATLEEAIAAANAGDTVKLLDDIDFREAYPWNTAHYIDISGRTLDLNGHTINVQNFGVIWTGKNLTIKNGTFVGEKRNSTSYGLHLYGKDNTGTALGDTPGAADVPVQNAVLEDLKIVGGANIWYAENVVLRNCNVQGQNYYAVWANTASDVTIESGTYTSDCAKTQALLGASKENLPKGEMTITGGDFTVPANKELVLTSHAFENVKISGGTFKNADGTPYTVPAVNLADDAVQDPATGTVTGGYIASVNDIKYQTLEEAIAAANEGDTVKLLADIDFTETYAKRAGHYLDISGLTINLDGHTITTYTNGVVWFGNNATIKNGSFVGLADDQTRDYAITVYGKEAGYLEQTQTVASSNITLEGLNVTGGISAWKAQNVVIKNCDVVANNYYAVWADVDNTTVVIESGSFTSNCVKTNGVIGAAYQDTNSTITVTGGDFTVPAKKNLVLSSTTAGQVNISGGTFNVVVPEQYCAEGFTSVTTPDAQGKYTVEPAGANNGVSLTIGKDITSNYYVDYTAYAGATKVVYTYNSISEQERKEAATDTVYLDDIPEAMLEDGRLKITVAQAPAQMAETTEIKIMNADEVLDTLNYSSKTYCDNIIAMDDDALAEYAGTAEKAAQLKTLCNTIIAYGYAAQGVFADYETTAITTADFSTAVKNQIDAAYCYAEHSVNNSGAVKFKSVSFACTKDARLRFYLDTAAATGTPAAPVEKNGYATAIKYVLNEGVKVYYIEVSGIDAVDFDKKMEVSYGGSSISCSVLDFCGLAFTHGDTPVQNLARTLIVYNQNAEAYFG